MCESCRRTATPRDLQPLRQSSTLLHRPRSIPRSRTAALYDRKSSVTNRSGTKAYFFKSLRISLGAACSFRLDWTSTSRTSPSARRPATGRPSGRRFSEDLVEMPGRARLEITLSQVGRDHRSEMAHPTPNRLVGHRHSASRKQILDVTQAEGEPEVEPYRSVNDFGREVVSHVAYFLHPLGYSATGRTASLTRRDNAGGRKVTSISRPSST